MKTFAEPKILPKRITALKKKNPLKKLSNLGNLDLKGQNMV